MNQAKTLALVAAAWAALTTIAQAADISGAGATFPYPIYAKWAEAYKKETGNGLNYQSIGSGGGIKQVTEGTVDFGASDQPMTDEQLKAFETARKSPVLHFPTVMGADVPVYNVAGVTQQIKFTSDALAGIFLGKITKWNDAAIKSLQDAAVKSKLPAKPIRVHTGMGTAMNEPDFSDSKDR